MMPTDPRAGLPMERLLARTRRLATEMGVELPPRFVAVEVPADAEDWEPEDGR